MDFGCCRDCVNIHEGICNGFDEECTWVIEFNNDKEEVVMNHNFKLGDVVVYKSVGNPRISRDDKCIVIGFDGANHVNIIKENDDCSEAGVYCCNLELLNKEKETFHSSHYESDAIEPIEFMMSNKLDFCRSSIIKYAFRAGKKEGQETLDITKIIDYALLLAQQEDIPFTKEDAQKIIDYRFNWKEARHG